MFVIVMVAFKVQDALSVVDIFDIFSDAGANEVVLKPAIGPFDFAFGLRREGIGGFDVTIFDDHLPLGVDVVGKFLKTHMALIAASEITKNGMAIGKGVPCLITTDCKA